MIRQARAGELGELLTRALRLQSEQIDLVLRGQDVAAIVEHLAARLAAPVWLFDTFGRLLASAVGAATVAVPPRASELSRFQRMGPTHADLCPIELATDAGVRRFLVQPVSTDHDVFGHLVIGATTLGAVDRTTLGGGRLVLALRMLIERSVAEAEERLGRDLIQSALSGDGAPPVGLATRLGYLSDGPAVVVVLREVVRTGAAASERVIRHTFEIATDELRRLDAGLASVVGGEVVAIMPPIDAAGWAQRVRTRVAAGSSSGTVSVGIADTRATLGEVPAAYREALIAVAMAGRSPTGVSRFIDLGLHRLLFDIDNTSRIEDHIERWIGPLRHYDAANGSRLVETLGVLLRSEGHRATARRLAIHPSTLKYRIGASGPFSTTT